MPRAAAEYDWEGFIEALRETRLLTPQFKRPGFPSAHVYYKRMKADQAFAARIIPLLPEVASEESYQRALRRLRQGDLMGDVLNAPGYPTRWEWRKRMAKDPAFAAQAEAVLRASHSRAWVAPETWQRVLRAAEEQPTLKAVAKLPGMPTYEAIQAKMKRDPVFDAAMRQHVQIGVRIKRGERDIEAAVIAIESGSSYQAIHRATGITRKTILKHIKQRPALAQRVDGLLPKAKKHSQEDILAALAKVGGEVSIRKLGALAGISRAVIHSRRQHDPLIAAATAQAVGRVHRGRPGLLYEPADYERALRHLQSGHSVGSLGSQGLPRAEALRRLAKRDRRFGEQYRAAVGIYRGLGDLAGGFELQRSLSQNELYAAVDRAVSRALPPHLRDEIRSEMIVAVLEGDLAEHEITSQVARDFVTAYHRNAGTWAVRSMDAPSHHGEGRTLHETIGG